MMENKEFAGRLIVSLALAAAGVISGTVLKKRKKQSVSEDKEDITSEQDQVSSEMENIDSFDIDSFNGADDVEDV